MPMASTIGKHANNVLPTAHLFLIVLDNFCSKNVRIRRDCRYFKLNNSKKSKTLVLRVGSI